MTAESMVECCGASGALLRAMDWSATALGPSDAWPARVTAVVEMVLASGFPLSVVLGPQPSGAIVVYNDPFIAFLGHKHPAAMGRPAREVWPEMWDFFEWALGQVWRSCRPVTGKDLQLRVERSHQNEEIYATISFSPIQDEGGAVAGALVCCIETTAAVLSTRRQRVLRRIAASLSEARSEDELYRAVATTLSAGTRDIPFALLYVCEPGGQRATLRASVGVDAPGYPPDVDLRSDDSDCWALRRVMTARQPAVVASAATPISMMSSLDGAPHEAAVLPLVCGADDHPVGALVVGLSPMLGFDDAYDGFVRLIGHEVARSIANVRAHQEAQQRAEAVALLDRETAESRRKDVFLGLASHELRTPLSCFKLNVELLRREFETGDARLSASFARLQRSITWMARLVEDLLSFSAVSSNALPLQTTRCDLREICRSAAAEQEVVTHRAAAIVTPDAEVAVVADPNRLGQVVGNLLSNAFKYSAPERPVTLTLRAFEGEAIVTVRDEGAGIPAEAIDHIFEQFYRTPGVGVRSGSYVGLGLGLFLCKAIVEQHGGHIQVASIVGKGSLFSFTVPLATPPGA